jgi:hypothetical protein
MRSAKGRHRVRILYHGTSVQAMGGIGREGLSPTIKSYGEHAGHSFPTLTEDMGSAENYARYRQDSTHEPVVLEYEVPEAEVGEYLHEYPHRYDPPMYGLKKPLPKRFLRHVHRVY